MSAIECIENTILLSEAASVSFGTGNTLPQNYSDLILVTDTKRTAGSTGAADFSITFNSDSSTNYSSTYFQGSGTTTGSGRASSQTSIGYLASAETSATYNGVCYIHLLGYSNTTTFKSLLSLGGNSVEFIRNTVSLWRSTSAITKVDVVSLTGNFKVGSSFSLWGVK